MSEAKSLVVWLPFGHLNAKDQARMDYAIKSSSKYEFAFDLSGRFLGVFREVRS